MFVDEVEPEEAVAVHASGVAESGENVPWGGYRQEEQGACEGVQLAPFFVFAG